ncbi:MAG: ATPase domain-containing protein [Candidatus Bathyarchaeia archaeon]
MPIKLTPTGLDGFDSILGGLPRGGLIILAGQAGTGKTILSAKILYEGAYRYGEPGVYASFAEDKHRFYSNMKGLGLDFEELERSGRFAYLDLITVGRLGVSSVAELIIDIVDKLKAKRLVVDSFSAIAHTFKDEAELRILVHSILSRICKDLDCTTILVEEVPMGTMQVGFGVEEFVADAVIVLTRRFFDERLLRRLKVVKLRGVELGENRLIFTLSSGVRVCSPFKHPRQEGFKLAPPPKDPSEEVYSTGIRDLDRVIGGYTKGSTIILEVDPKVEDDVYELSLLLPLVYSFMDKRRPVIIVPSLNTTFKDVISYGRYIGYSSEEARELLRVVDVGSRREKFEHPLLITLEGRDIDKDYDTIMEYLRSFMEGKQPPLAMAGLDTLIANYGVENSIRVINLSIRETRIVGGLNIVIVKPIHPRIAEALPSISRIHLKLSREHGTYILYGVKPRTGLYALDVDTSRGYIETKLTPIR